MSKRTHSVRCIFGIVALIGVSQLAEARDVKGEGVENRDSPVSQVPMLIETSDLIIRYDPALRLMRVEREDGSTLTGTILDDEESLFAARFRLENGDLFSISISPPSPQVPYYAVTTSIGDQRDRSFTTTISDYIMQTIEGDSVVSLDTDHLGKQTSRQLVGIIAGITGTIMACGVSITACNEDVLQDQSFCHNGCGSASCNECCYDLATGDMRHCNMTCGANGPDGDYGNCTSQ